MTGIFGKLYALVRSFGLSERGITGLETAIVLIAFVVVAAVFAFVVITTGLFSGQRAQETAQAGLKEARTSLAPKGSIVAIQATVAGDHDGAGNAAVSMSLSMCVGIKMCVSQCLCL